MNSQRALIHGVILGVFCLGFGTLLAVTNGQTEGEIAQRAIEDMQYSLSQVIPDSIHDNNLVTDAITLKTEQGKEVTVYRASKEGKPTGVAYEISSNSGYSGLIRLMLGVDPEGKVLGVRVLMHRETPGLGDKIEVKKGHWILDFDGLSLGNPPIEKWKVKKDGGQFDQFAGATITPRAVVTAIREGLQLFDANKAKMLEPVTAQAQTKEPEAAQAPTEGGNAK